MTQTDEKSYGTMWWHKLMHRVMAQMMLQSDETK